MKPLRLALLLALPALLCAQTPDLSQSLRFRLAGPFRGGRVVAVAGVPSQPNVYYFGGVGGGVWKTTDGGGAWLPMSDGQFKTSSVGAIAVADSDPNVVYVGMGESCVRGNASNGDGVYKSVDGGKTWRNVGLEDSQTIGAIRVHPRNPDIVYVAALGHLWGPNEMRGVYRSTDGGGSWKQVFTRGPDAGAVDLAMDPANPRVLYASFWQVRRNPYHFDSGGPGSGLDRYLARSRPAAHRFGTNRHRRLAGQPGTRLGHRGSGRRRRLPLRQFRPHMDQSQRSEPPPPARLVLQPHLRRSPEYRHGLRAQHRHVPVD
jgi:hypothetical protein